jgi:hypothetical protein
MLLQDVVTFLVYGIGFVAGFELVDRLGTRLAWKMRGEANPPAATNTDPGLERRQSKTRELLIAALTVAMVIAAYNFLLPPGPGFLVAAGGGGIVALANLVARVIVNDKP